MNILLSKRELLGFIVYVHVCIRHEIESQRREIKLSEG